GPAADVLAGLGDEGGGALFRQAHALGQLARGAVVALLDLAGAVDETAADVLEGLLRAPLRLGDAFAQAIGDAGDLAAQLLQGHGVPVVGGDEALLQALGEAAHVGLDLAGQDFAELLETGRIGLDPADAAVEVLGDSQHLAAHGLDGPGGTLLGRLDLVADGED